MRLGFGFSAKARGRDWRLEIPWLVLNCRHASIPFNSHGGGAVFDDRLWQ
jgi:hypothetical protein